MIRCDALVAGLGIMGSAATLRLARRRLSVVAIDQFTVPHDRGSSHGETRNIRQAIYESPAYVPLLLRAFELWEEQQAESGTELLRLTGRVMIGARNGPAMTGARTTAQRYNLPLAELSPAEVRSRFPVLEPSDEMIGIYEERAGMLFAERCLDTTIALARRAGADVHFGERLVEWAPGPTGATVRVRTTKEEYETAHLVLAVGAWLPGLVPALPLSIERQVLLWFEPKARREDFMPGRFPIYLWELDGGRLKIYGVPYWGDGLKVARHHGGEATTVDALRRSVDEADVAVVRAALERYMPAAAGRFIRGSVCMYTNTPDEHFLIDRHPDHPAVTLMSPCSGHGFKFAPALGEGVAELIADGKSRLDLSFFRGSRFGS